MEIDLFTFIIQIVNFCILIFMLNRFLFSKVRKIMEERNSKVNKMVEDAKSALENAEKLRAENQRTADEFELERAKQKEILYREIESLRKKKETDLEEEMKEKREKEIEILNNEFSDIREKILRKCAGLAGKIADKVLYDIVGIELEERISSLFLEKLDSFRAKNGELRDIKIIVKSSFKLKETEQNKIEIGIRKIVGENASTAFLVVENFKLPYISTIIFEEKVEIGFEKYLEEIEKAIAKLKEVT